MKITIGAFVILSDVGPVSDILGLLEQAGQESYYLTIDIISAERTICT